MRTALSTAVKRTTAGLLALSLSLALSFTLSFESSAAPSPLLANTSADTTTTATMTTATTTAKAAVASGSAAPSISEDAQADATFVIEKTAPLPQDESDLWQRIRRGFAMEPLASGVVQEQEKFYVTRPDYIRRFVERGSKYMYHIVEEVERRNMPTEIVLLPIIESAFNPQAYSRAAASGMWQFIPSTGKNFGLKQDYLTDHRRDVLLSTDAALDYLQKLYGMFNSWELALAAYNCGEGCVGRAIRANQARGLPTDFLSFLSSSSKTETIRTISLVELTAFRRKITQWNRVPGHTKITQIAVYPTLGGNNVTTYLIGLDASGNVVIGGGAGGGVPLFT